MDALNQAITLAKSQAGLALLTNEFLTDDLPPIQQGHVSYWVKHQVSARYVITIARALGYQVTPHELRPDIYPDPCDGMPAEKRPC